MKHRATDLHFLIGQRDDFSSEVTGSLETKRDGEPTAHAVRQSATSLAADYSVMCIRGDLE